MLSFEELREKELGLLIVQQSRNLNGVEQILLRLVDEAKREPHRRQKFAAFKWKSLETVKSSQQIGEALQATLECSVSKHEVDVIFCHYRTRISTFDYAAFLLDFAKRYEQPVCLPDVPPRVPPPRKPSHGRVLELWQKTRHEVAAISAANGFIASIDDKSRQRALLALEEAVKRRATSRFSDNLAAVEGTGNIEKKAFRA